MIQKVRLQNYGRIKMLPETECKRVNLILGENGRGKTFLLKSLYSAIRCLEEYGKGDDVRTLSDILSEQLRWCFQAERIGDLVTKGTKEPLQFYMLDDNEEFSYSFTNGAEKKAGTIHNKHSRKQSNSIFLPAKEVLSLFDIIQEFSHRKQFGFDSTYSDLVNALSIAPHRGKNHYAFRDARTELENMLGGKADYDEKQRRWYYKEGSYRYSIGVASEGVKKISILDRLLANGYLTKGSVVFIDELESALHPEAITTFLNIIALIAENMDIQFFISSHSYHVVKKLHLLAKGRRVPTACLSFQKDGSVEWADLAKRIPSNSIIEESVRLYEEELDIDML